MRIKYEQFNKHLKDITMTMKLQDDLLSLSDEYNKTRIDEFKIWFPSLIDNVIELLANLTNDLDEWIPYWVYELDCGKKAEQSIIKDRDGNTVPLSSIEDLWNLLASQEDNSMEE